MVHTVRNRSRVATASIAGYRYQLLHTVRAWLELRDDELIVAEGNEDIDRICISSETHIEEQVKQRTSALSQGDTAIAETILRYLEAFAYHQQNGHRFRGVLRTNAKINAKSKTAIGAWILGQKVDVPKFRNELQELVSKRGANLVGALHLVLSNVAITRRFLKSVEWASDSPDVDATLTNLLVDRAPGIDVGLTRAALLDRLFKRASSPDVAMRTLRRIDADIALTDCALDTLQEAALEHHRISQATISSKIGPPSVAVALLFESVTDAKAAVAKEHRKERLGDRTRRESLHALAESLEFIGYPSVRHNPGPKGEHVCVKDVIRQSGHRHTPKRIMLRDEAPRWMSDRVSKQWVNASCCVDTKMDLLLELSDLIGAAILTRDTTVLKKVGTKLRWIHVIDERKYYTAANPFA